MFKDQMKCKPIMGKQDIANYDLVAEFVNRMSDYLD